MALSKNVLSGSLGPIIADIDGVELTAVDKEVLMHPKLGGLIFFSRNFESRGQLIDLVRQIREVRPSLLLTVDHEGGRVQRFREGFSAIPPMGSLGKLYDENPTEALISACELGWLLAYELTSIDIDHSYAPVLDLDDDKSKVIVDRSFSIRPEVTTLLAEQFISGMNDAGMVATAKHFPGHGSVVADSHLELPVDPRSYAEILCHDLKPFIDLKANYGAVMTAHVSYPDIDDRPVSFSSEWIQGVLRKQIGFEGVVLSDDLSMKGADDIGDFSHRAKMAIQAGCDAVLICNQRKEAERVLEYLESNALGCGSVLSTMKMSAFSEDACSMESKKNKIRAKFDLG